MLIFVGIFSVSSSCNKSTKNLEPREDICNTYDPINNLPWLKAKIDSSKNLKTWGEVYDINSYNYGNNVIFEINYIYPTMEAGRTAGYYYCDGIKVCGIGRQAIYQHNCPKDFFSSLINKKTIYKSN